MKAVDYFMLTSFGFIFAALIEYIIVLNTPDILVDCCFCCKKKEQDEKNKAVVSNLTNSVFFMESEYSIILRTLQLSYFGDI